MEHTVEEIELKTGSRGLIIEIPGSRVMAYQIGFRAGFRYASSKLVEIPHVMEHTIYCANAKFATKTAVQAAFEKNGAWENASTAHYLINYMSECANFEAPRILNLLTTAITSPLFKPKEVITEIGNIREELNSRISNHGIVASDLLRGAMTKWHTDQDGLNSLVSINSDELHKYHRQTHSAANMFFIMAGDLGKASQLVKQLETETSKLQPGHTSPVPKEVAKGLDRAMFLPRQIPQIYYDIFQWFDPVPIQDWPAYAVLRAILTTRFKSWIFGEARRLGLAYHIDSSFTFYPSISALSVGAFVMADNSKPLFKLIASKLRKALSGEFRVSEIEEAKKFIIGSRLRAYKNPGDIIYWYADDYFTFKVVDHFHRAIEAINAVGLAEVRQAAARALGSPKWGLALVGDIDQTRADELHGILAGIWK